MIEDILPYLGIKRRGVENCPSAASMVSKCHRGRWAPRPPEEWDEQEHHWVENANLNWPKGRGRRERIPATVN